MWPSGGATQQERTTQDLPARPDDRGTSKRRRIVISIVVALIASSFATQCRIAPGNGETISVRIELRSWGTRTCRLRYAMNADRNQED